MRVKVRHGAVTWQQPGPDGDREVTETAFRGMTVDMPATEVKRLRPLGAVVDADAELPMGGRLSPVPSTASDSELIAWASVANRADVIAEITAQPRLGDRLMAAWETVQKQMEAQNELLGGLRPDIERAKAEAAEREAAEAERKAAEEAAGRSPGSEEEEEEDLDDDEADADNVVKKNVGQVSRFLAENPGRAEDILDAENRRAAAPDADPPHPRVGVLNAVQAAAGHTQ